MGRKSNAIKRYVLGLHQYRKTGHYTIKAIFCVPAHPAYFDPAENYTQDEIEAALRRLDGMGGRLFKGMTDLKVPEEFRFLRVPGQPIQVIFDSAGYGDGKAYDQASKDRGVKQYRG